MVPLLAQRLEGKPEKSGISRTAPPSPEAWVHRLPPILRIPDPPSVPSCSKAPRGLLVLARVTRIFTRLAISPSPSLRQRPSRYAIRAGRYLADKEFRYLRTVIVTAAVHRGFGFPLARVPLTFRHWAGVSPYTSPYGFAETCVFGKQSPRPVPAARRPLPARGRSRFRAPLLPKLRGHFAEFLNEGSLVHLGVLTPTYQWRFTVRAPEELTPRLFLPAWTRRTRVDWRLYSPRLLRLTWWGICLPPDAYESGTGHVQWARSVYPPGSPLC